MFIYDFSHHQDSWVYISLWEFRAHSLDGITTADTSVPTAISFSHDCSLNAPVSPVQIFSLK